MIVLPIIQFVWYRSENNRRDKLAGPAATAMAIETIEFTDKTDFEQWRTFRYTM